MRDASDRDPRHDPWQIDAADFPAAGAFDEQAVCLLRAAVLAPSGHNTQPWRFALREPDILVFADSSRRLPVADPDDRELTMSLGAAIMHLRVAAAAGGLSAEVATEIGTEYVARVTVSRTDHPDPELAALFPAVTRRRTWRLAMDDRPLDTGAASALTGVSPLGSASLEVVVEPARRRALESLVREGDLARMADKSFRKELALWMRPAHTQAEDGLAGDSLGLSAFASHLGAWSTRAFDLGESIAAKDAALAAASSALVVVFADDLPGSLLDAGQLAGRFLLTATLHGAACSFFNLPVEIPALREQMRRLLEADGLPQLLLRVGYPAGDTRLRPSARRPVSAVIARAPRGGAAGDLTEDELRWMAGGTQPTEDEPFLPG